MNNKLTQKQENFCINYINTTTITEAAIKAGYSPKTALAIGSENLRKPIIQARIKELQNQKTEKMLEKTVGTKLEAGQVATEILRARFSDFDIDNITKEQMSSPALRKVTRQHFTGGKGGRASQTTTKIELDSPLQAAEYLAKLYGWYEQLPEGYQDNRQYNILVADERTKDILNRFLSGEHRQLKEGETREAPELENGK